MYKNQLQELAQRSCFNLPSYACVREGPDHAPRFKASVNFHGEIFEGPSNCTTVRQAEHAAAEVALTNLSTRGPSRSLAARVLDETGVYKNLLQETAHRAGMKLPVYTTVRTGPGHQPIFTCTVELAGMSFTGESAKTKKQAEKNAALAAWSALKQMPDFGSCQQSKEIDNSSEEHEQVAVTRVLAKFSNKEEDKTVNQRNPQQYQRRRMMLGSRECFQSSHNFLGYNQHKWKCSGSSDVPPNYPLQMPHQRSLISSTGAKRLPSMPLLHQSAASSTQEPILSKDKTTSLVSTLNNPLPMSVAKKILQTEPQDVYLYLEKQLQKDGDQQIARKQPINDKTAKDQTSHYAVVKTSEFTHVPLYARAFPRPNASGLTQVECRPFTLSPSVKTTALSAPATSSQVMQIPAMFATGGFCESGIAPAVNIRTAIPVYASPPMRPAGNTITATNKEEGEVLATSSILKNMHL